MRNEFWLGIAALIAVLTFVLPTGNFQSSLNQLGRISRPLTEASLKENPQAACKDLSFELYSRQLSTNPIFWLIPVLLLGTMGMGFYANSKNAITDQFLFRLALMLMGVVFLAQVFELSKQYQRLSQAQTLTSSYCSPRQP